MEVMPPVVLEEGEGEGIAKLTAKRLILEADSRQVNGR
jgi:hypothetical protein